MVYMDSETKRFFKEVLNLNPDKLAMQYEAFIVGGSQGVVKAHKKAINDDISECCSLIAEGLDLMLKKYDIQTNVKTVAKLMNYTNYERKIVEYYGVELRGWPCTTFKNPGGLRRDEVSVLLAKLDSGGCRWHKLSEEELLLRIQSNTARHLAGEEIYKPRKKAKETAVAT